MMGSSANSDSKNNYSGDYINRGKKEEEFIREIINSLNHNGEQKDKPFLFFIDGIPGIGKHRLVNEIKDKIKQKCKKNDEQIVIHESFNRINKLEDLLDLMKRIDDKSKQDNNNSKNSSEEEKSKTHFWEKIKVSEDFSEALNIYRETLKRLELKPIEISLFGTVSSEQQKNTELLRQVGGILAKSAFSAAVMAMNPAAAATVAAAESITKSINNKQSETTDKKELGNTHTEELAGVVGGEIFARTPELIKNLKDRLLNKHLATRGNEKLQKLLLSPLEELTPKFISSLITRSKEKPVVLIFERYETANTINQDYSVLDTWFYYLLESLQSKLIKEIDKNDNHKFCLIITSREKLTTTANWKYWEEKFKEEKEEKNRFVEHSILYFKNEEIEKYLKKRLSNKIYKELTKEEIKNYCKISCGHPKYLELVCKEIEPGKRIDDSQINRDITKQFFSSLSPQQRKVIQLVSCCQYLDKKLIDNCIESLQNVFPRDKEAIPLDFNWFDWLKQRDFVSLENDKYHFDPLPRKLFRRSLFQEDREQFYRGHEQLAEYFQKKADGYLPDKPNFAKYNDSEWCEYIGQFLYHACFTQRSDFEAQFIYHLFASSYLNQKEVLKYSFWAIDNEANLQDHPFLHDTTKTFLTTLKFVAIYSWAAFELDSETDYGKYKDQIAATVLLCKSQLDYLDRGIGKVAVLEFILKNLPINSAEDQDKREPFEQRLFKEIENTADESDPDFSSTLFMQSAFWQSENIDNSLKWCDKAIEYKRNNANAWYRRGKICKDQAEEILVQSESEETLTPKERKKLAIDKYQQALSSYNQALNIQPFDHRFWQARGDILQKLGKYFLSIERQILELIEGNNFNNENNDDDDRSGTILQKATCYLRAYDSYDEALRFQPLDNKLEELKDESFKNCNQMLKKLQISLQDKKILSKNGRQESFRDFIKNGDEKRLDKKFDYSSDEEKEKLLKKALDFYNKAIYEKPEYPLGWYCRGLALNKRGEIYKFDKKDESEKKFRKAIEDFQRALDRKEDLSWAFYDRGISHYQIANIWQDSSKDQEAKKEYKNALKDFDQAIKINSEYYNSWYYRGLVLDCLKHYEQAIASFDKTIQICHDKQPKDEIKAWYDRGKCYKNSRENEEAIASFMRAIAGGNKLIEQAKKEVKDKLEELITKVEEVKNKLEEVKEKIKDKPKEVKEILDEVIAKTETTKNELKEAHKQLEETQKQLEEVIKAEKTKDKLKEIKDKLEKELIVIAKAEEAKEKLKDAKDELEKVITKVEEVQDKADPLPELSHINSLFQWGVILYEAGEYKDAIAKFFEIKKFERIKKFQEGIKFLDVRANTYLYWGKVFYKLAEPAKYSDAIKNFMSALKKIEQVIKLKPNHEEAWKYWGLIYAQLEKL